MHELAPLIYDLAVMLGLAGIVTVLFQRIHQPVVLGYLIAGMIVGPNTPPYAFVKDINNIQTLSELGVVFLMFSLGLEFSFKKLTQVGFSASVTGIVEVVLMLMIGYGTGYLMGWSYYDCLFLGAALSISSTTIIIKAIEELQLKSKRFAELIFGVLIVEDLLAILLLVALSTLVVTKNIFSLNMVYAVVQLILVVGGWFLIGYFIVPPLFRRIANYISQETLTIVSVALCLFLVCVAAHFHYSAALGAFIMGSILAETVLVHRIEELIRPIRDIFAAVFFISVGMLINPIVIIQHWPEVILITLVTIVAKVLSTTLGAFLTGQSINTSLRSGFSMAQIGEFSFIIAALGLALKVTSNNLYPLVVAVSSLTTFTTPYLIRLSGTVGKKLEHHLPQRTKFFIESYSNWIYRTQTMSQQNSAFSKIAIRFVLNGMVVAIIFTAIHYGVFHHLKLFSEFVWTANAFLLLIALLVSSPFIWGMLFAYKRVALPEFTKITQNPLVYLLALLTLIEVSTLSIVYFHAWATTAFFMLAMAVFLVLVYKQLERSYHWFELQLLKNLKLYVNTDAPLLDMHLVVIDVPVLSTLVGKKIIDCQFWQQYQLILIGLERGTHRLMRNLENEIIQSGDKLLFVGEDKKIEVFIKDHAVVLTTKDATHTLTHFKLNTYLLTESHPLLGLTIQHSHIEQAINGALIGLERNNQRILNPNPETVLIAEDLLLLVGEDAKIKKFKAKN